ncbi:hypothetical protein CEXT_382171 [Caerostris extrusa]|uniref:Uncharacterized protein n=1 Tax=Caerostris extrusa TaxID=172846 RepID=A0AAV4P9X1_CAEEX|nr:hypothetical protein CEXT_382171 [Caerostris extrusa]
MNIMYRSTTKRSDASDSRAAIRNIMYEQTIRSDIVKHIRMCERSLYMDMHNEFSEFKITRWVQITPKFHTPYNALIHMFKHTQYNRYHDKFNQLGPIATKRSDVSDSREAIMDIMYKQTIRYDIVKHIRMCEWSLSIWTCIMSSLEFKLLAGSFHTL